jgi:exopolysaccharide biosynthesis polyprenyl glycosylphosphotransferase
MVLSACDLLAVAAAYLLAMATAAEVLTTEHWLGVLEMRISVRNLFLLLAYLALWHTILRACGLYRSYRLSAASREVGDIAIATGMAVVPLVLFLPFDHFSHLTPSFVLVFATLTLVGLAAERRLLRVIGRRLRVGGRNLRNVVVIGTGEGALDLTARLVRRNDFGYRIVAVIDCGSDAAPNRPDEALQLVGSLIDAGKIDEVFLAVSMDTSQPLIQRIVARCEEQGIAVRLATQIAALHWARSRLDVVEGQPIITVHSGPLDSPRLLVKRALDVLVAGVALAFAAPIFLLSALAITLDSPGPVFFLQERVGQNRRRFVVRKFRTMAIDAEARQAELEPLNEAQGPVFKIARDPRVTRVGHWLRRTSVDELPQLLNVLAGDMSLVGPRPLPVRDVDRIDVRWHRRRFSVKPGITCLWQVESRQPTFDEWIRLDMKYIDNWSLGLDLKILARTIPAVLSGQGAS